MYKEITIDPTPSVHQTTNFALIFRFIIVIIIDKWIWNNSYFLPNRTKTVPKILSNIFLNKRKINKVKSFYFEKTSFLKQNKINYFQIKLNYSIEHEKQNLWSKAKVESDGDECFLIMMDLQTNTKD